MMIGHIMKLIRKSRNKTGVSFSDVLDVSPGTLWSIESGKVNPSVKSLDNCAQFVGVSTSSIIRLSEYEKRLNDAGLEPEVVATKLETGVAELLQSGKWGQPDLKEP